MCGCPACTRRKPILDESLQQKEILRQEKAQDRDEARRDAQPQQELAKPQIRGCVFAKSCELPNGLINYSNPSGFIPVELLTQYGDFSVLGKGPESATLAWIGGSSSATALTRCLGGTLATVPAELAILAVVLIPDTTSPDWALYTLDQYTTLTSAKTRVRLNIERLADNCVRAYGFYTGNNKDWENVPVVAATADGERFVVDLGQGIQLIWTPTASTPLPILKGVPPLPPVWVYPPTETAKKVLGNPVHPPEYQDMVIWFPKTEIPPFYISFCTPKTCPHPDMMEELAEYIAGEMNRNIHDPVVLEMKQLIHYDPVAEAKKFASLPAFARLNGPPNFSLIAKAHKVAATAIWTKKVAQNQAWDHKPTLQTMYNNVVWHKQGNYAYFYDIWSNIHYGYIGSAAGFSENLLLDGAGLEQIGSDLYRQAQDSENFHGPYKTDGIEGLRAWDDVSDRISIGIGMELYKENPKGGLTARIIMNKVLSLPVAKWGKGVKPHECK